MSSKSTGKRWYLGTARQWHWISSAVCLVGLLLFAVTGITLNHASLIPAKPVVTTIEAQVPAPLLAELSNADAPSAPLPKPLRQWLASQHQLHVPASAAAEWDDTEIYLSLPRPGGDAWLSLDLESGDLIYERTERGVISYLNDLHKGRHTGTAWRIFIDLLAVACLVFSVSGLLLLQRQAARAASTWPLVGLGLVVPVVLILLFVHP